jgi:aspartyl protease
MPRYDAENFEPPAPVAYVTLRNSATGASLSDVPLLMDTGADISLLSSQSINELSIEPEDISYEVQGFDGASQLLRMVRLELIFVGKKFSGQFLLIDQPIGILGRNILNSVSILIDGLNEKWEEHKL